MRRSSTVAVRSAQAFALLLAVAVVHAYDPLPQDLGAVGVWQKLQKLRTIASAMHTTAHPDDEHGGLLALLSRRDGARVSLLTLTRGESGDNAIGSELFDALGLIRTEELLRADQYYGVDQQYFTSVVDYGFSKRLDEALEKWGRQNVLRDVVRILRTERPMVLIARFQGNERDGHGNHQAAGLITQEAYRVSGDPTVFPEQIREGLRPWQPFKLYMGGVRENEDWTIRVDTNIYSPWLGGTYANFARAGLSFQRSQNSGRVDRINGPAYAYYKRLASRVDAPAKESNFFDGIDLHPAWFDAIARDVDEAVRAFSLQDPARAVPALERGLAHARDARSQHATDGDVSWMLAIKQQQFADAITTARGINDAAVAQVDHPVIPGETFDVRTRDGVTRLTVPADAPPTKPAFSRSSIAESRYTITNEPPPVFPSPVVYRELQAPYGYATRTLVVVPAIAVNVTPRRAIVPVTSTTPVRVEVEVANNDARGTKGELRLNLPAGWRAEPSSTAFAFARVGEKARYTFAVTPSGIGTRDYTIDAVATANGREYREGYDVIAKRDLETRYLYHASTTTVRGVDVKIAPGLKVGYVMGVGDEVPSGIAQLGVDVQLLTSRDLASADLSRFTAIMTGTRAYGVRDDLRTYNQRLLEYVKNGGNLIVLYNTPQEFDPKQFAPFPAVLPRDAEEVSEEDSPIEILAPNRAEFTTPNRITQADFDGWVEQRGSKFFSSWDAAYTPMIATHDQGQPPQRGGWLTATYGKGHWTYFAYAFHRQLPYAIPGAYRLLANLLSPLR